MGTKKINLPQPKVLKRPINKDIYNKSLELGMSDLQSKIVASRPIPSGTNLEGVLRPTLSSIPAIEAMTDIGLAADRISDAIIHGETIGLLCDFDVDGISSCAVLTKSLIDYFNVPSYLIQQVISNRMQEGYGFSQKVLERVLGLEEVPTLLITADQGSSDGERVTAYLNHMKSIGISTADVVVTDHHEIPSFGGPVDAFAFVNPQQNGDLFPDKTICGCTVALFVMVQTRIALINKGYLPENSPKLSELLSYSTAATIADCVSMASATNRAIVKHGLKEINEEKIPPWRIMKKAIVQDENQPFRAENVGFGLGPRINACSRTGGDGLIAVRYYLSETDMNAQRYFDMLDYNNEDRKKIEKKLVEEAIEKASVLVDKGHLSLVIFLPNGHHGIHGIVASRVVEKFGRPVICLSPKSSTEEMYTNNREMKFSDVEHIIGKKFADMKALRGTIKHPKNTKAEFVLTKKENYKDLSGEDRILKIELSQKIFTKDETQSILNNHFNVKTTKTLKTFYSISDTSYVKIEKKNKTDHIIRFGSIDVLSGSARSIDGLNTANGKEFFDLHHSLSNIDKNDSSIFAGFGFGGHTMAAGMALSSGKMQTLIDDFEKETRSHITISDVGPKIFIDGELPYDIIDLNMVDELLTLEPYGRSFDFPTFALSGVVNSLEIKGKNNDTGIFKIIMKGNEYTGVWFNYIGSSMFNKIKVNDRCRFVVRVTDNFFRGQRNISLQISHAIPY